MVLLRGLLWWWVFLNRRYPQPITDIAQSFTTGIFIRDTAHFIVIQWSMTLYFMLYNIFHCDSLKYNLMLRAVSWWWKCLMYGTAHLWTWQPQLLLCSGPVAVTQITSNLPDKLCGPKKATKTTVTVLYIQIMVAQLTAMMLLLMWVVDVGLPFTAC